GRGDGTTTFNLPDLRGRFLRGTDAGAKHDPDAATRTASGTGGATGDAVGSLQGHDLNRHQHALTDPGHAHASGAISFMALACTPNRSDLGFAAGGQYASSPGNCGSTASGLVPIGATASTATGITLGMTGGAETRPANIGVSYIIKQ